MVTLHLKVDDYKSVKEKSYEINSIENIDKYLNQYFAKYNYVETEETTDYTLYVFKEAVLHISITKNEKDYSITALKSMIAHQQITYLV